MSQIASKNLYELLGNDPELDPDRAPDPPTKVVDKPAPRTGKRNPGPDGPGDSLRASGGGRGGSFQAPGRGDQAGLNNRDDGLRSDRNSNRTREPREFRGDGRGRGRGRGGRGGRGGAPRDDRHSHTGIAEHEKQAAHGWGGDDGNAEWADEKAGEAIANAETNNDPGATPDTRAQDPAFGNGPDAAGEEDAAPEEEQTKSYDQYLADLAEKRMALGDNLNVRKPNEGASKTFPEGKAISRTQEENFFIGSGGKNKKAKEAQDKKERLTLDGQYYAAADSGDRGGRGRGRGGDRGGGRGGRGGEFRGGDRGRGGGRGRGEFRGGRGGDRGDRAERGDRGGRGGARGGFNATDESAFPALS